MEKEKLVPNARRMVKVLCLRCKEKTISSVTIESFVDNIVSFTTQCICCVQGYHSLRLNPPEPKLEKMTYEEFETFIENAKT